MWWSRVVAGSRVRIGGRGPGRRRRSGRVFLGGWRDRRPGGRGDPGSDAGRRAAGTVGARQSGSGPEWLCLPAGAVLAAITWSVVPMVAGMVAMPLVRGALRGRAERAAAERTAAAVSALCGTLAGDLRAGRPPHAALADAVQSAGWPGSPELGRISGLLLSAARFGGDVPRALRTAARVGPGAQGLAAVAACWQVAVDGGAGLAAALDRVAAALRAEADQREDLRAQLAGPRSTAVLLALLPVFGLVLGTAMGADPAGVLLHTPAGLACLVAGAFLEWAGLAWTAHIIRAAEGGPPRGAESDPRGPEPGGAGTRSARAARGSAAEGGRP
ncbi:type II secretion system F family protein [Streptomyces sp. NBC_00669]|nr:type II secretion system F family protein [Streptomyces sp. NBC_00669]